MFDFSDFFLCAALILVTAAACLAVLVGLFLALICRKAIARSVRRRWPGVAQHYRVAIAAIALVLTLPLVGLLATTATYTAWTYTQYWLNEPLVTACGEGNMADAQSLLDRGASPNAWGIDGDDRAITAAAGAGKADIVALLLARGANVNVRDSEGRTALKLAKAGGTKT